MRIVLSNSSSKWGGVHRVTEILAHGLQARGHDVIVFGMSGRMLEERMRESVQFEPVLHGIDFHPVAITRSIAALRRHRADVVMTLKKKDVTMTGVAARSLRIPFIVRHPNQQGLGRNLYWKLLYGVMPAMHVANAQATKRTLLASSPWLRPESVRVIYNGVDVDSIERAEREDLQLPHDAVAVGYAGSFERRKGVLILAEAWKTIAAAVPNAHLILVGKGAMEERMKAILGDTPRVRWLGYRGNVAGILKALDLAVLPSYVEGAPNIVLEAMSARTAVLATAVSGTPELIHDGVEGKLIPPGDPDVLAAGVIDLLRDRSQRIRFTEAARARVTADFALTRMLDEYEALFTEIGLKR